MRHGIPGLVNPFPLSTALPAIYLEDELSQHFVAVLDEALAPVLLSLDCLDAYLDPGLTPPDFLDWLAGWVCAPLDPDWPEPLRRELLGQAVHLHRWRGTAAGLEATVRLMTGGDVEIVEGGGVTISSTPSAPRLPESPSGTALSGTALSGTALSGTALSGTAPSGTAPNGPASGAERETFTEVRVRVRVADPAAVDGDKLREVVAAAVPAHVRTVVEVVAA